MVKCWSSMAPWMEQRGGKMPLLLVWSQWSSTPWLPRSRSKPRLHDLVCTILLQICYRMVVFSSLAAIPMCATISKLSFLRISAWKFSCRTTWPMKSSPLLVPNSPGLNLPPLSTMAQTSEQTFIYQMIKKPSDHHHPATAASSFVCAMRLTRHILSPWVRDNSASRFFRAGKLEQTATTSSLWRAWHHQLPILHLLATTCFSPCIKASLEQQHGYNSLDQTLL